MSSLHGSIGQRLTSARNGSIPITELLAELPDAEVENLGDHFE
jgi:hypothetical protein